MLSKILGWLRSRVCWIFFLIEGGDKVRIVMLYEYEKVNGLGGEEYKVFMDIKWWIEVFDKWIVVKYRWMYELFYVFGLGLRELEILSKFFESKGFKWEDGKIEMVFGKDMVVVNVYVYVKDGFMICYWLEGNVLFKVFIVVFSNFLLIDYYMWDELVVILKVVCFDLCILRYDICGRYEIFLFFVLVMLDMFVDDF